MYERETQPSQSKSSSFWGQSKLNWAFTTGNLQFSALIYMLLSAISPEHDIIFQPDQSQHIKLSFTEDYFCVSLQIISDQLWYLSTS